MPLGPFELPVQSPRADVLEKANFEIQSAVFATTYVVSGVNATLDDLTTVVIVAPSGFVAVTSAENEHVVAFAFIASTNIPGTVTVVAPLTVAVVIGTGCRVTNAHPAAGRIGFTPIVVPSFAPTTLIPAEVRTPEYVGAATTGAVSVMTLNFSAPAIGPGCMGGLGCRGTVCASAVASAPAMSSAR